MKITKIRIYNTLSGKKDVFKPLKNKRVNLFVCGPTVYDFSHIGHARIYIIFDCFARYLKKTGYDIFYLQNITNIDDKIIARAKEKEVLPKDLARAFEGEYLKNMRTIGIASVKKYARATDYIKEIINQIKKIIEKGYAYRLDDGIYFNISKFKNYGKLSGRTVLQAEDAISRIDYSKNKKNRGDFCLWKFATPEEPKWPSVFGDGRPGWHIEDTAITEKFFGTQYDIHGGGRDLIFPHHEAEIAQIESISGKKPMARYWMHVGFLTINGQKMSKSLKNIISIDDFLKRHSFRYLRFWVAKNLWRSPLDYSESSIIETKIALEKIEEYLRRVLNPKSQIISLSTKKIGMGGKPKKQNPKLEKMIKRMKIDFYKALSDDFNTPKAFAGIFNFIRESNKLMEENAADANTIKKIKEFFKGVNEIFGIINFSELKQSNVPKEVEELVKKREFLRKNSEWQKADELRIEIEKYGFFVEDTKVGAIIKKIHAPSWIT